jgi:hypothetical protein
MPPNPSVSAPCAETLRDFSVAVLWGDQARFSELISFFPRILDFSQPNNSWYLKQILYPKIFLVNCGKFAIFILKEAL